MIERGKFRSLTLVNWNGFFARTFDLDELVTTLSGGNGAGKSTTMAAFVTALIPDLTLLHFRNTTEAGATSGSRDKGLHGKLRAGVCYSVLDVINSRHQRVVVGVRLQQVAGRDRKVDIKPFAIQGLPTSILPTQLLTETLNDRQARVVSLNELKDKLEAMEGVQFKQFNSITEYHSLMFDLGVVARRLRSASDRSKYYRLIEASLYGGISSTITRSLRDYLLPENSGVRKAFQDMEAALRENRMTLEAIRVTQSDRDLFKHLISEATNYVAADYMRHANERRIHLDKALEYRRDLFTSRSQLAAEQYKHVEMARELLKRGWYLGFDGPVTYKSNKKAAEVLAVTPLERILVETDSPYMAPEPCRGKRNDSSLLVYVLEKIAALKGVSAEEMTRITQENGCRLFGIEA